MAKRADFRKVAPKPRPTRPEVRFPTPNTDDVVIVEDVPIEQASLETVLHGTPRDDDPLTKLVWQGPFKGDNNQALVRRIYANNREAQDAYNYALKYVNEGAAYPIYIRTYIEPRHSGRWPDLTPLDRVVRLFVFGTGGTGYPKNTTITITGGGTGATGATGKVEVFKGVIVAAQLTNGGTGYSVNPTVTVNGVGGTGGAVAARVQDQGCLLVREERQPAEGELASLYEHVTRVFKKLPGPELKSYKGYMEGRLLVTSRQEVATGTLPTDTPDGQSDMVEAQTANEAVRHREYFVDADGAPVTETPWLILDKFDHDTGIYIRTRIRPVLPNPTYLPPQNGIGQIFVTDTDSTGLDSDGRYMQPNYPFYGVGFPEQNSIVDEKEAYVIDSDMRKIEGSAKQLLIVQSGPIPPSRYTFPFVTWTFPAKLFFNFDGAVGGIVPVSGGKIALGTGGVTREAAITLHTRACKIERWSLYPHIGPTKAFNIVSPGADSAYAGNIIDRNTLYGGLFEGSALDFILVQTDGGALLEKLPMSIPRLGWTGSPSTGSVTGYPTYFLIQSGQEQHYGEFYKRTYLIVKDPRNSTHSIEYDAYNRFFEPTTGGWGGTGALPVV